MPVSAKKVLVATFWLLLGAVFGPVAIAGIAALYEEPPGMHDTSEAVKLVDAYRDELPPFRLFLSLVPPDEGKACGYDPGKLFPSGIDEMANARKENRFSDFEGYYALERWAADLKDEAYIAEITSRIEQTMGRREMKFLRRCIQSTLFASACMRRVERYGDVVERFPDKMESFYFLASGHEQEVICTYLDAIAARRGLAVPKR